MKLLTLFESNVSLEHLGNQLKIHVQRDQRRQKGTLIFHLHRVAWMCRAKLLAGNRVRMRSVVQLMQNEHVVRSGTVTVIKLG